jgi:hypothetical protein
MQLFPRVMNRWPLMVVLAAAAAMSLPASAAAPKHKPARHAKAAKKLPAPVVVVPADAEQLEAAKLVYLGHYDCEFKQTIDIAPNDTNTGYVDVKFGKANYLMKPVLSSTGAVRLEDVQGHTLMVQIARKSMLLDVKAGHRLVDECVCPAQQQLIAAAEKAQTAESAASAAAGAASAAASAAAAAVAAADAASAAANAASAVSR